VLPVIVCVLPDRELSLVKTAQYVAGAVMGAIVAVAVIVAVHDPLVLALLAVALIVIALSVQDLSYALFVFCLTIMLLLLISIPMGGPALVGLKVATALVGGAIALAVTLLWSKAGGTRTAAASA
jgi:uncharacterized membrane protein YgaE (UPF0421/DUF939 family)